MRIFLACLLLGGCVKKDSGLSAGEAQSAGQALGAEVEDGAKGFGSVAQGAAATPACTTLSGDTADPDGDSIPNHATVTFNCSDTSLGYTGTLTGTLMVTDTQPAALAWAFAGDANLHATLTGPAGGMITTDRTGTITAAQGSAVGPYTLARTLTVTTVLTTATQRSTTVDVDNDWTITYTPTATWMPGTIVIGGKLEATGSWNVAVVGGASASATLATPTPLTLTPSCESRVTAGEVTATYADGAKTNTITVTWTGCGASTVTQTTR